LSRNSTPGWPPTRLEEPRSKPNGSAARPQLRGWSGTSPHPFPPEAGWKRPVRNRPIQQRYYWECCRDKGDG
jgi:hypothetical protein